MQFGTRSMDTVRAEIGPDERAPTLPTAQRWARAFLNLPSYINRGLTTTESSVLFQHIEAVGCQTHGLELFAASRRSANAIFDLHQRRRSLW